MKRFISSIILIFLFISQFAFSETLQDVTNQIYSTLGAPQAAYDNGYFWYLPDYCIMILYDRSGQLLFIAFTRKDNQPLDAVEIIFFLKDKGRFELRETRIESDEYRAPGLVAKYDRDAGILFIVDEKRYAKKQSEL